MTVYVIGHKNPDTDAVCSAIGYAEFLRATTRPDAVAATCGDINARTRLALERAGAEPPMTLLDVRPRAGKISRRDVISANEQESMVDVYERMRQSKLRAIPVLDENGCVKGMCSLLKLLELLLPDEANPANNRRVETSLARIATVLHASFQCAFDTGRDEVLTMTVGAMSADNFTKRMREYPAEGLIVVAGDRPTVQLPAIEYGVRCLIVTGGYKVSEGVLSLARERNVTIINSPQDTATTTLLIRTARKITSAVETDFLSFSEDCLLCDMQKKVQKSSQPLFPIVDDDDRMVGVLSKSDLINPEPYQLVLVDHNEIAQAVTGAEDAKILEVIDHHRLGGGLISREPIRFHNEPLGSTCTIVAHFFKSYGLTPTQETARCLAAGIISDTLKLSSPTTTAYDGEILKWIAEVGGIDIDQFAEDFFAAGSALELYSPREAVRMDCKEYRELGWSFAVAQIEENSLDQFWEHKEKIECALDELQAEKKYAFVALMITDITRQTSLLLVSGSEEFIDAVDYAPWEERLFDMGNVVSRKKQLLPHIISVLSRIDAVEEEV